MSADMEIDKLATDSLGQLLSFVYRIMPRDDGILESSIHVPDPLVTDLIELANAQSPTSPNALLVERSNNELRKYQPTPSIGLYRHWFSPNGVIAQSAPLITFTGSYAIEVDKRRNVKRVDSHAACYYTLVYEQLLATMIDHPVGRMKQLLFDLRDEALGIAQPIDNTYAALDPLLVLDGDPTPIIYPIANDEVQKTCGGYLLPPTGDYVRASGLMDSYLRTCSLLERNRRDVIRSFAVVDSISSQDDDNDNDDDDDEPLAYTLTPNGVSCASQMHMNRSLSESVSIMLSNLVLETNLDAITVASAAPLDDTYRSGLGFGLSFPINIHTYNNFPASPTKSITKNIDKLTSFQSNFKEVSLVALEMINVFAKQYLTLHPSTGTSPIGNLIQAWRNAKQPPDEPSQLFNCLKALSAICSYNNVSFGDLTEDGDDNLIPGPYIDGRSQFPNPPVSAPKSDHRHMRMFIFLPSSVTLRAFISEFKYELCVLGQLAVAISVSDSIPIEALVIPRQFLGEAVTNVAIDSYMNHAKKYLKAFAVATYKELRLLPQDYTRLRQLRAKARKDVNAYDNSEMRTLRDKAWSLETEIRLLKERGQLILPMGSVASILPSAMSNTIASLKRKRSDLVGHIKDNLHALELLAQNKEDLVDISLSQQQGIPVPVNPLAPSSPTTSTQSVIDEAIAYGEAEEEERQRMQIEVEQAEEYERGEIMADEEVQRQMAELEQETAELTSSVQSKLRQYDEINRRISLSLTLSPDASLAEYQGPSGPFESETPPPSASDGGGDNDDEGMNISELVTSSPPEIIAPASQYEVEEVVEEAEEAAIVKSAKSIVEEEAGSIGSGAVSPSQRSKVVDAVLAQENGDKGDRREVVVVEEEEEEEKEAAAENDEEAQEREDDEMLIDQDEIFTTLRLPTRINGALNTYKLLNAQFNKIHQGIAIDPVSMDYYLRHLLARAGLSERIDFISPVSSFMTKFIRIATRAKGIPWTDMESYFGMDKSKETSTSTGNYRLLQTLASYIKSSPTATTVNKPLLVVFPIEADVGRGQLVYMYEMAVFKADNRGYKFSMSIGHKDTRWEQTFARGALPRMLNSLVDMIQGIEEAEGRGSNRKLYGPFHPSEIPEKHARLLSDMILNVGKTKFTTTNIPSLGTKATPIEMPASFSTANVKGMDAIFAESQAAFYLIGLFSNKLLDAQQLAAVKAAGFTQAYWATLKEPLPATITCQSVIADVTNYLMERREAYLAETVGEEDPVVHSEARPTDIDTDSLKIRQSEVEAFKATSNAPALITASMARSYLMYLTRRMKYASPKSLLKRTYVLPPLLITELDSKEMLEVDIDANCRELRQSGWRPENLVYIFLPIVYGRHADMADRFKDYEIASEYDNYMEEQLPPPQRWELIVFGYEQGAAATAPQAAAAAAAAAPPLAPAIPLRIIRFLSTDNPAISEWRDDLIAEYSAKLYGQRATGAMTFDIHHNQADEMGEIKPDSFDIDGTFGFICLKARQLMYSPVSIQLSKLLLPPANRSSEFKDALDLITEDRDSKSEYALFTLFVTNQKEFRKRANTMELVAAQSKTTVTNRLIQSELSAGPVGRLTKQYRPLPFQRRKKKWNVFFNHEDYHDAFHPASKKNRDIPSNMVYIYMNTLLKNARRLSPDIDKQVLILFPNMHKELDQAADKDIRKIINIRTLDLEGHHADIDSYDIIIFPTIDTIREGEMIYRRHRMHIVYNYGRYQKDAKSKCFIFTIDPTYDAFTGKTANARLNKGPVDDKTRKPNPRIKWDKEQAEAAGGYPTFDKFEDAQVLATLQMIYKRKHQDYDTPIGSLKSNMAELLLPENQAALKRVISTYIYPIKLFVTKFKKKPGEIKATKRLPGVKTMEKFTIDCSATNTYMFYKNFIHSFDEFLAAFGNAKFQAKLEEKHTLTQEANITRLLYGSDDLIQFNVALNDMRELVFDPLRNYALRLSPYTAISFESASPSDVAMTTTTTTTTTTSTATMQRGVVTEGEEEEEEVEETMGAQQLLSSDLMAVDIPPAAAPVTGGGADDDPDAHFFQ